MTLSSQKCLKGLEILSALYCHSLIITLHSTSLPNVCGFCLVFLSSFSSQQFAQKHKPALGRLLLSLLIPAPLLHFKRGCRQAWACEQLGGFTGSGCQIAELRASISMVPSRIQPARLQPNHLNGAAQRAEKAAFHAVASSITLLTSKQRLMRDLRAQGRGVHTLLTVLSTSPILPQTSPLRYLLWKANIDPCCHGLFH